MANSNNPFVPRPMNEVKEELLGRAKDNRNPFLYTIFEEVAPVIAGLESVDREAWARGFSALAVPHEERAAKAAAAGDTDTARTEYLVAYDCHHVARYPAPNSPGKLAAYRKSQENFLKAARYFDPPLERVEMPFNGKSAEGKVAVGLLRKPKGATKPPVVVLWGGIDAFKEERPSDPRQRPSGNAGSSLLATAICEPGGTYSSNAASTSRQDGLVMACRSSSTSTNGLSSAPSALPSRGTRFDQSDPPGPDSASNTSAGSGVDAVNGARDVSQEHHRVVVSAVQRDPREGARIGLGPLRKQRRLAVTGRGDHGRERQARRAQLCDRVRLRHGARPGRGRGELDLHEVERNFSEGHREANATGAAPISYQRDEEDWLRTLRVDDGFGLQRGHHRRYGMRGAGRAAFAAILLLIAGTLNIIYGIGALDSANIYANDTRYIFTNLNTMGWVLIVLGRDPAHRRLLAARRQHLRPGDRDRRRQPRCDRGPAVDRRQRPVVVARDLRPLHLHHPRHRPAGRRRARPAA